MQRHNDPILILGLAREGISLVRYFAGLGNRVIVTDSAPPERLGAAIDSLAGLPVEFVLGGDHPELVHRVNAFYVSPGVPEDNPVYRAACASGLTAESMTRLFFNLYDGPAVGVTGSSGKTTTTGLIAHMLTAAGIDVALGGNIGSPMLDLIPVIGSETVPVLELSSFQLALLERSPSLAVVTNISPNHLDRHGTMEAYIAAKRNIVAHQKPGDIAVLNADDPTAPRFAEATPARTVYFGLLTPIEDGATVQDSVAGSVHRGRFTPVIDAGNIPLLGKHNLANVLAAIAACTPFDLDPADMRRAIETFTPAPHRLQTVGVENGVRFIDDSIATSPARAAVALEAIDAPVLLIAGGRDKHLPWDEFAGLVVKRVRALLLVGEAANLIEAAVRDALAAQPGTLAPDRIVHCDSLDRAVSTARSLARPGDVVLLSPGCTSYDMFTNFEERGRAFQQAVEAVHAA